MGRSRLLKIAIPLIILLLAGIAYQYGYVRIQGELAAIKETEEVKAKTLAKYIALISEKPELEKKLAALKEIRKSDSSKLIEGQTFSLAAASLQDMVKNIVTGRGGTISSERVGKPDDLGK